MYIDNLILEVTRQCNLKCRHCLRGSAQRLKMSREVMHAAMTSASYIGCLTLTGGEPSLATSVIEEIVSLIRWRRIRFRYFYIVTNGKTQNNWRKFLKLCDELYQLAEEQSECVLTVSQDQFHREMHTINLNKFQDSEWGEDLPYFHHEIRKGDIMEPLAEGRAATNGLGWKDPVIQKPWRIREEDGEELEIYEGEVYVSANGNVTEACDMSYARVDAESKGNILTTCLADIVRGFCVKEEEQVSATA